jgi:anti-sigma factor RsiW
MSEKNLNDTANSDRIVTMDCRAVAEHVSDFVDQELSLIEKKALEDHLNQCPECAAYVASYRHVVDSAALLREPEEKPLPVDVQNRLRKALNQRLGLRLPYIA